MARAGQPLGNERPLRQLTPAHTAAISAAAGESLENIGPGWRARETWRLTGPDSFVEVFELAAPGKDFTTYSETRLTRRR